MSGKKGMKNYPASLKSEIVEKHRMGQSVHSLHKEFGISRWAIQCWCGLTKEAPLNVPKRKGRPRKTPATRQHELELEVKQLKREIELYRSFLQAAGRM